MGTWPSPVINLSQVLYFVSVERRSLLQTYQLPTHRLSRLERRYRAGVYVAGSSPGLYLILFTRTVSLVLYLLVNGDGQNKKWLATFRHTIQMYAYSSRKRWVKIVKVKKHLFYCKWICKMHNYRVRINLKHIFEMGSELFTFKNSL